MSGSGLLIPGILALPDSDPVGLPGVLPCSSASAPAPIQRPKSFPAVRAYVSPPSVTTLSPPGSNAQPSPSEQPKGSPLRNGLPSRPLRIGILGATGAVGEEILHLLKERELPVEELRLLASPRSAGHQVWWGDQRLTVEAVEASSFEGLDLVLASAGGSVSKQWAPQAVASGAVVIDNSSAFRMDPDVPLVVPEVNPQAVFTHRGIIANPNCTTILLCLVLAPLEARRRIRRVVVSTYQSASGAGARAMEELRQLTRAMLEGETPRSEVLPFSLAFNLFLHNSPLQDNGYCEEELKMLNETRKIMGRPDLLLSATCVRVPVLRAHSEAVNIEFEAPLAAEEARSLLGQAPGVVLIEDHGANRFPMPIDVTGQDPVAVGRIRQDLSHPQALELWLCGDQIRKGAALNAIQIAELLMHADGGEP